MRQLITPNPNIPCAPGWCLQYVRQAFGLPAKYGSATEAWEMSTSKHRDRNFPPGLWVPVWYGLDTTPLGHVVLRAPDGSVYSTSDLGNTPHHHPDLADLESYYAYYGMALTYRGWTEDVASYAVMAPTTIQAESTTITRPVTGGLTVADINSITKQLNEIQAALAPINTSGGPVDLRQFIADGTRAAQAAEKQTGPINVSGGQEGIRDFIAKGTRAAQASAAKLAALEAALKTVSAGGGVDLAAVTKAAEEGAAKALSNLTATVTIEQEPAA